MTAWQRSPAQNRARVDINDYQVGSELLCQILCQQTTETPQQRKQVFSSLAKKTNSQKEQRDLIPNCCSHWDWTYAVARVPLAGSAPEKVQTSLSTQTLIQGKSVRWSVEEQLMFATSNWIKQEVERKQRKRSVLQLQLPHTSQNPKK